MKNNSLLAKTCASIIAVFTVFCLLRVFQFVTEPGKLMGDQITLGMHVKGILHDFMFALVTGFIGFILAFLVSLFKVKSSWIIHLSACIFLCMQFCLSVYYLETQQLLGEVFFSLKSSELSKAVDLSIYITFPLILSFIGVYTTYFMLFYLLNKKTQNRFLILSVTAFFLLSSVTYYFEKSTYNSLAASLISPNKSLYFLTSAVNHYTKTETENYVFNERDLNVMNKSFFQQPLQREFPFFHPLPETSNLNALLNHQEEPPNIVYIIVESLSNYMFGENADVSGRMMPFLDSLSKESIYFPNILSTCERTHNVLPASLTSIPNPPNGIQLQTDEYPMHWSLISLLKNSYYSRYYCGVYLNYANMKGYMEYHQTNYLVKNWSKKFSQKIDGKQNPWGYPDGQLFEKSAMDLEEQQLKKPRFDVFLTISTHAPFMIPNKAHYLAEVKKRFKHNSALKQQQEYALRKPESLATYAYTDDALRAYFNRAKKDKSFNNTIFIIFGDHGNHDLLLNGLDPFKTSMLIYSPLQKKPQVIRSVSTHLDIAPSLLNFLRINYPKLHLPNRASFYGREISIDPNYKCQVTLPLNTIDQQNKHLVMGDYVMLKGILYRLKPELIPEAIENSKKLAELTKQLQLYNRLIRFLYDTDHLIPRTVFEQYVSTERFVPLYTYHYNPTKAERTLEFIHTGDAKKLEKKWVRIKIVCDLEAKIISTQALDSLPKLTYDISNIRSTGEKKLLIWKQTRSRLNGPLNPKGWTKVRFSTEINLRDYANLSEKNLFTHYLLNVLKKQQQIRNISTEISYVSK